MWTDFRSLSKHKTCSTGGCRMERDGNGAEPQPWFATSVTSADIYQAVHTSDFLVSWMAWEHLRGSLEAHPWSVSIPWASASAQVFEETATFPFISNTGPQAVTYSGLCSGGRAGFCSQGLSGLGCLKQISIALQRQSTEQSTMRTLCLTRPIGQILPEEKARLRK